MLSRALILATVMISILIAAPQAQAQNLEAGKSPSQLFSNSCSACHRSQRGLLKTVPPGSLPGFLREHYTTSKDMAQTMSAYLLSNGATDPRGAGGRLTKQGQDAKSGGQSEPSPDQPVRTKRNRAEQQPQQQAAPGPDGQPVPADEKPLTKRQKQKLDQKKARKEPKPAATATPAPAEVAKPLVAKPEVTPAEMPKPSEQAPVVIDPKIDAPKAEPVKPAEPAALRPDPVPQVTPAPSTPAPVVSAPAEAPAAAPEPSDAPPKPTISVTPPPPPAPPSGPAAAPISQ
jgi:hypothetical protein